MGGFMDCCGLSDIGRKRSSNEDQFLIADVCKSMRVHHTSLALDHQTRLFGETQGKLMLVADGMGGHEAGERASQLAIDGFVDYALNRLNWFMYEGCETDEDFEEQLRCALISCQKRIDHEVSAIPQRRGMGSTLTLAYIVWPKMFLVHVGDTRCYLFRDGQLQQLTRDHTLAELSEPAHQVDLELEQDERGNADEEAEIRRPMSNVLWNVIGGDDAEPHPDASAIELAMGDTILLCSDGLTNSITRKQLKDTLSSDRNTAEMCRQLIDEANSAGGSDNITVVIGRFLEHSEVELKLDAVELPIEASQPDTVDSEAPVSVELLSTSCQLVSRETPS